MIIGTKTMIGAGPPAWRPCCAGGGANASAGCAAHASRRAQALGFQGLVFRMSRA